VENAVGIIVLQAFATWQHLDGRRRRLNTNSSEHREVWTFKF